MSKEKLIVEDPYLGEREIDMSDECGIIRDQRALLKAMGDRNGYTAHLREDIKVYDFILNHDNPQRAARSYMDKMNELREQRGALSVKKAEVAKLLGWDIYSVNL